MHEGRSREAWEHTAILAATVRNKELPKKHQVHPDKLNPWVAADTKRQPDADEEVPVMPIDTVTKIMVGPTGR
jgi:hypothetical protein